MEHTSFEQSFRSITQSNYAKDTDFISLGHIYAIEHSMFIVKYMDRRVDYFDSLLEKLQVGTDAYADVFAQRLVSYDEHRFVLETNINEEKISRLPVYRYLYLDDAIEVERYKNRYLRPDISMRESYTLMLKEVTKRELPALHRLLCEKKINFFHPIENLLRHTLLMAQSSVGKSEFLKHIIYEMLYRSSDTLDKSIVLI